MCNLAGYSGKHDANPLSIKLLAIYGRNRGKDGFGIVCDKKLYKYCGFKGQVNQSDSLDLIYGRTIDKCGNVVIMHNRWKTKGFVNESNTHPFEFNDIEGKRFIFAHNGTISNIEELADNYKVAHHLSDVDSKIFGEIIYRHGFNVLTEYEGYAAFSLYDVEENALYLWRGFSECDSIHATEERPLFYYQNKRHDKLYYSSEFMNLITALNTEDNIQELEYNCLTKIVDGKIVEKTYYDRSNIKFQPISYPKATDWNDAFSTRDQTYGYNKHSSVVRTQQNTMSVKKVPLYKIESCPQNESKGKIYCWKGLYWANGHVLNGAYLIQDNLTYTLITAENLNDKNAEFYEFFRDGYMLSDYNAYCDSLLKHGSFVNLHGSDICKFLHNEAVCIKVYDTAVVVYKGRNPLGPGDSITPKYSNFTYLRTNLGLSVTKNLVLLPEFTAGTVNAKVIKPQKAKVEDEESEDEYYQRIYSNFQ